MSSVSPPVSVAGWYGKLSTLGDFASRRLSAGAVQVVDRWLAEGLASSQQQLGDDWLQSYLASPLQRFVLAPGLVDESWWFGVLMPSCDKVGRYFPLLVMQSRSAPPTERFGFDHLELWWQRAGEAALETLSESVDVERFEHALSELPPWPAPREVQRWALPILDPAAECVVPAGCTLGEMAQGFAAAAWTDRLQGHSLWWSWWPQAGTSTCRIVAGLPAAQSFAVMFSG
jgi:type VI secretion system protein ImpM